MIAYLNKVIGPRSGAVAVVAFDVREPFQGIVQEVVRHLYTTEKAEGVDQTSTP